MDLLPPPLAILVLLFAGWVNRQQQAVIDYLLEENRILRAAHGTQRIRLTDEKRRRLAVKVHTRGHLRLAEIGGVVTPDTILRWYRTLVARNTMARTHAALVVRAPRRTLPLSSSAWHRRTRRGATRGSAVLSSISAMTSSATRSKRFSPITASSRHRIAARTYPGKRSSRRTGTASRRPISSLSKS